MKNETIIHNDKNKIPAGFYKNNTELKSIVIPDSVSEIGAEAFSGCTNLTSVKLPKSLKKISKKAFENCSALEKVEIPFGVTEIEEDAFLDCKNLENIILPESITTIGESAFEGCLDRKLDKLIIPGSVKTIGDNAFSNCAGLEKVIIQEGVSKIGERCFENCTDLKEVTLPNTIFRVSDGMFRNCASLKEVHLPNVLRFIEKNAFQECTALKQINLPDSIFEIKESAFANCIALKSVKLPNGLRKINNFTFDFCIGLKSVEIPESVVDIGEFAFSNCFLLYDVYLPDNLKIIQESAFKNTAIDEITIPDSVEEIGMHAFRNCGSLESVTLSSSMKEISSHCFSDCTKLNELIIPEGVKKINSLAFVECSSLEKVTISNSVEEIEEDAFLDCASLQFITIPDTIKNLGSVNSNVPYYFSKSKNGFILSMESLENSISTSLINLDLPFLARAWNNKDTLLKEQRNPHIVNFYNKFLKQLPEKETNEFLENHNFTFFKKLNLDPAQDYTNLYKLLYNLGGFKKSVEVNGKQIDYSQKVFELLFQKIKTNETTLNELNNLELDSMRLNGFNIEFTEFFLNNFSEIIQEERINNGFISRCFNEFDTVQKTNTRHHGKQEQLKPTVKKFVQYFDDNKFVGITPETKPIADSIAPYFSEQEVFDEAVKIFNEKKSRNTPNNITNERIKETDVFTQIDNFTKNIQSSEQSALSILTELAKKEFTYDWLEKNDPENFILGKLCSCCSHLEGSGYGIMKASIVDPDVQTLVIRDKNGDIIAKSTLFINPEEQYGVFNNVEIKEGIKDRQKIYEKYIAGIQKFTEVYNKNNPLKPLKQINVGMHYNDLYSEIHSNTYPSTKLLKSIDYGKVYGKEKQDYNGDSHSIQYTLWENDEPTL